MIPFWASCYFIDYKYSMGNFYTTELHPWKKRTCTRKLLLNLIQTSKSNIHKEIP